MANNKRLGIDIDGTITCPTTFIPYINHSFNLNLTLKDLTVYDLATVIGITSKEFYEWMIVHEHDIYRNASLVDHALHVLAEWEKQHQLIYISARNDLYKDVTHRWFVENKVPFHHVELIGKHDKLDAVKKHNIDVFFEDKHDNACDIGEECDIPVILFNAPYNQDPIHKNVIRVNNWQEANNWVNYYFTEKK
ncbi:hypothetical protein ACFSCX_08330 [Bacillus salitolerans]|uniref:Nucleotidase n=1 Tax=Bacillus salitolerans TaxID=1437434 RepID=A0ABW4LQ16_9BACI